MVNIIISTVLTFLLEIVKAEGNLFAYPFINLDVLWVVIPIYLGWFFAEFFQEKRGTSLGNAISNGTIAFWVGADWARTTLRVKAGEALAFNIAFLGKMFMAFMMFVYGMFIIVEGIKAKKMIHYAGRIRVVTYFVLMLTPLFYGHATGNLIYSIIAMFIFFPAFYYLIELIDYLVPDNAAIREETEGFGEKPTSGLNEPFSTIGTNLTTPSGSPPNRPF
ncbi:MAG: hypothetical protein NT001_01960 [Candidatus Woesearchaeota archaeon]|nr:hypothetical protein [Candidatus Woesearchaeota archaeon]